eukprot:TRINITY_DN22047_c0_g1_i1.p1 TRINITY_DN22047_c0_g1~~TRINITY_DN22047_c0_g1_i1.p1  ORF type:complete len:386 (+),score=65.30 TRINITY_DN22047_c0_g1_i1:53-1159(+)
MRRKQFLDEFSSILDVKDGKFDMEVSLIKKWCEMEQAIRSRSTQLSAALVESMISEGEEDSIRIHVETVKDAVDKKTTILMQLRNSSTGEPIPISLAVSEIIIHTATDVNSPNNEILFKHVPLEGPDTIAAISLKSLYSLEMVNMTLFLHNQHSAYKLRLFNTNLQQVLFHEYGLQAASPDSWQVSRKAVILSVLSEYLTDNRLMLPDNKIKMTLELRKELGLADDVEAIPVNDLLRHFVRRMELPGGLSCRLRIPGKHVADGPPTLATTKSSDNAALWKSTSNAPKIQELDNELQHVLEEARNCRQRRDKFVMFSEDPTRALYQSIKENLHGIYMSEDAKLEENDLENAVESSALCSIKRHHCDDRK